MLTGKKRKNNKKVRKLKSKAARNQREARDYNRENAENKKLPNKKLRFKLSVFFGSLFIVSICVLLLSRYTKTTELLKESAEINSQIKSLEDKKGKLELELEEIKDSGWIEEQAKIRMNMKKAKSDQIIFIDVE